jgi:hypothetical protein
MENFRHARFFHSFKTVDNGLGSMGVPWGFGNKKWRGNMEMG